MVLSKEVLGSYIISSVYCMLAILDKIFECSEYKMNWVFTPSQNLAVAKWQADRRIINCAKKGDLFKRAQFSSFGRGILMSLPTFGAFNFPELRATNDERETPPNL